MNSKAQGLPLNTIVIALLVIVVLVVVILAFTTNIGQTNQTFEEMSRSCSVTCSSFDREGVILSDAQTQTCAMSTYNVGDEECCCRLSDESSSNQKDETPNGNTETEEKGG